MDVLVFTAIKVNLSKNAGILNKAKAQAKALFNGNNRVFYGATDEKSYNIYGYDDNIVYSIKYKNRIEGRIKRFQEVEKWCVDSEIDIVYVRYDHFDVIAYNMFKNLRKNRIKVILEIPTYPFENEKKVFIKKAKDEKKYFDYVVKKVLQIQENINFQRANKVLDLIVTYNPTLDLFGVKTLCIDNGVWISDIPIRSHIINDEEMIFALVANLSKWHGADRFIEGLKKCHKYGGYEVKFWIIGDGNELPNLKNLVKEYKLERNVIFWGAKTGEDLQKLLEHVDVGVASLGMHRLHLDVASTLKVKEYCAFSLPFIYAYSEREIPNDCNFALKLPADESPVNIQEVMEFASKVHENSYLFEKMRMLAEEKFDWKKIMDTIIRNV